MYLYMYIYICIFIRNEGKKLKSPWGLRKFIDSLLHDAEAENRSLNDYCS